MKKDIDGIDWGILYPDYPEILDGEDFENFRTEPQTVFKFFTNDALGKILTRELNKPLKKQKQMTTLKAPNRPTDIDFYKALEKYKGIQQAREMLATILYTNNQLSKTLYHSTAQNIAQNLE